ncbi:MAG TPA: type II toxin-antitoxin system VapC family toxin [Pararhizobium sp.]|uniref:type II toxin-antitoxin system VapC family toxin n=1 Tax=Pararhizobium sp. TaxID=1977563 RepID=UPI002B7D9DF7|nr:type II toxin-antitoxin system VapC family toxin [Pararhizobium sp.]HTO32915.1 type II toxin-antitoxin system VapC family toxin [Pararhizobium sp.]
MSGFLLDTNAISAFAPARAEPSPAFAAWLDEQERANNIFLSAVTVHELEKGIRMLMHRGATAKAEGLRIWLLGLTTVYADNILPLDAVVTKISGELEATAVSAGYNPGATNAMIAGTAKANGLTVITNNLKDFVPFSVAAKSPAQLVG